MDLGHTATLPVHDASQVAAVRRRAQEFSVAAGLDEVKAGQLAIIASEMATNLVKHGGGGSVVIQLGAEDGASHVDILSLDKGRGMVNVQECMQDGFSTFGSAGTGLGAIQRQSDGFDLYSQQGKGTVVWSRIGGPRDQAATTHDIAGLSVHMERETVCGDGWGYYVESGRLHIILSDGLGHGQFAHEASESALRIFDEGRDRDPGAALLAIHKGLRSTRGAAASVAVLDGAQNKISFCGVGNVTGLVIGNVMKQFAANNGTLGHTATRFNKFEYPCDENAVLVLYSDGLQTVKSLEAYPGLLRRRPMVIAGVLYRDLTRGRDDTTVVVAKRRVA